MEFGWTWHRLSKPSIDQSRVPHAVFVTQIAVTTVVRLDIIFFVEVSILNFTKSYRMVVNMCNSSSIAFILFKHTGTYSFNNGLNCFIYNDDFRCDAAVIVFKCATWNYTQISTDVTLDSRMLFFCKMQNMDNEKLTLMMLPCIRNLDLSGWFHWHNVHAYI